MSDENKNRSLIIFNAMLKTGRFKKITPEMQGLYDAVVSNFKKFLLGVRLKKFYKFDFLVQKVF